MRRLSVIATVASALALLSSSASASASWVASQYPPPGAIVAGWENNGPLYLCHAPYADGIHPGKVVAGKCNIGYGGGEQALPDFEWAIGSGVWASPYQGRANPLAGGVEHGRPLLVCKAHYVDGGGADRGWHPGKVVNGNCNITWGGAEIPMPVFQEFYQ